MPQSMMEVESEPPPKSQERAKKKNRKWTFGGLFRRKKGKETSSDSSDSEAAADEGKKGGFLTRRRRRRTANRGSKDVSESFEHVILRPAGGNVPADGRKSVKARVEANRDILCGESSSEEDRSPRIPRAHRSSKRLSKDMSDCSGMKVMELDSSPRSPRWTAKVVYCESSDYEARYTARTRSATPSPAQSPVTRRAVAAKNAARPPPRPQSSAPRPFHCQKSASFDLLPRPSSSHHPRVPPPPPPRDPQRRIVPPLGYAASYDRPLSYAFESHQPMPKLMMDHNSNLTPYKVPSSGSLEKRKTYQYYTDQQPRSRRPIHIARADQQPYLSDSQVGRIRTNSGSSDWRIPRDSNSSLYDSSDSREGPDARPLSMVLEATEHAQNGEVLKRHQHKLQYPQYQQQQQQQQQQQTQFLPNQEPPQQRQQQQAQPQLQQQDPSHYQPQRKSNNLEDALDELEAIYKSLQMRDEEPPSSRGFESDSGYYRVIDDMAYRRLNRRDSCGSPDSRKIASQTGSYLLVSPALSPPPFANAPPVVPTPQSEPDITLDDVVYRSLRQKNNTLKITDPQPPFGIPLGPIAPAPGSDYLHATPKPTYRPTFKPRKTPDIVKDDLAFRNLRKDSNIDSLLTFEGGFSHDTATKKKRAVRSLSANLLNIIQKENLSFADNRSFSLDNEDEFDKTRSYSDLPDILSSRHRVNRSCGEDSDATPRVSRMYPDVSVGTTSTETLTDSRTNIMAAQEYCSNRQNQVRLPTAKSLPKTDLTKPRLPSPHKVTASPPQRSKFLHSVDNDSSSIKLRVANPTTYMRNNYNLQNNSTSPTTVNLEKYMQRYENNNTSYTPYSNSSPVYNNKCETTSNGIESYNNHNQSPTSVRRDVISNGDNKPYISSPMSLTAKPIRNGEQHQYHVSPSCSSKIITEDDFAKHSIISVNTDKYLRGNHTRTDVWHGKEVDTNPSELSYQSSPFIYIGKPVDKFDNTKNESRDIPQSTVTINRSDLTEKKENIPYSVKPVSTHPVTSIVSNSSVTNVQVEQFQDEVPCLKVQNDSIVQTCQQSADASSEVNVNTSSQPRMLKVSVTEDGNIISAVSPGKESDSIDRLHTKTSNTNKPKVPAPRTGKFHEKAHQKASVPTSKFKPSNSRQNLHIETQNGTTVDGNKRSPVGAPSLSNRNDKSKQTASSNQLTANSEKSSATGKPRIPSPRLSLTPDRSVGDNNKARVPSPRLSSTLEKQSSNDSFKCEVQRSESQLTTEKSARNKIEPKVVGSRIFSKPTERTGHSCCKAPTNVIKQTAAHNDKCEKSKQTTRTSEDTTLKEDCHKLVCKGIVKPIETCLATAPVNNSIENGNAIRHQEKAKTTAEFISKSVVNAVGKTPPESPSKSNIFLKLDDSTPVKQVGDDLNKLLTEINTKQQKLLCDNSKFLKYETSVPPSVDKKDNAPIGKITQHRPVKLNTFFINDNDAIENDETTLATNRENEIMGSSESMTDLLRELTRSLDQDFGGDKAEDLTRNETVTVTNDITISSDNISCLSSSTNELYNVEDGNGVFAGNKEESCYVDQRAGPDGGDHPDDFQGEKTSDGAAARMVEEHAVAEDSPDSDPNNDKTDCPSDDSNAEFVEQIRRTASELSALSSSTSDAAPASNTVSPALERARWSRQQSLAQSDRAAEGTVNSRTLMLKPFAHISGLVLFCTHCMAHLHQLVDVDFLTALGILIAVVSILLLLVL